MVKKWRSPELGARRPPQERQWRPERVGKNLQNLLQWNWLETGFCSPQSSASCATTDDRQDTPCQDDRRRGKVRPRPQSRWSSLGDFLPNRTHLVFGVSCLWSCGLPSVGTWTAETSIFIVDRPCHFVTFPYHDFSGNLRQCCHPRYILPAPSIYSACSFFKIPKLSGSVFSVHMAWTVSFDLWWIDLFLFEDNLLTESPSFCSTCSIWFSPAAWQVRFSKYSTYPYGWLWICCIEVNFMNSEIQYKQMHCDLPYSQNS